MPLPLIPLILGGASAIASAFGIKKGIDAKSDFEMAEYLNKKAQFVYEESSKELQSAYNNTRQSMNILGETKFRIYEKSIIPFVECFSMIKKN